MHWANLSIAALEICWHTRSVKSLTEHLWFETPHRRDYLNITGTVEKLVRKSAVQEGLCLINAMHITPKAALIRQKTS